MTCFSEEIYWHDAKCCDPQIPEGKHAVKVLVEAFDSVHEEISPGKGAFVLTLMWTTIEEVTDYYQLCYGSHGTIWMPFDDEILHWAYMPKGEKG